jgi:hypothetical protein
VSKQIIDRSKLPIRRQIDGTSAKARNAGLAEAHAGMGGWVRP